MHYAKSINFISIGQVLFFTLMLLSISLPTIITSIKMLLLGILAILLFSVSLKYKKLEIDKELFVITLLFTILGLIYTMFIGIFMLPFYLEYLGAEAYGVVGFFTMLTSIMMLLDMGFSQALVRETAKLKDKIDGLMETINTKKTKSLILGIFDFLINRYGKFND